MKVTQKRLREVLDYDPATGIFIWLEGQRKGRDAGCISSNGYVYIKIDRKSYFAHRLAYLYTYGYFPEYEIDHLSGIKNDNGLSNLREVSRVCNLQNQKVYKNNTSGFPGVCWQKQHKKWMAGVRLQRKRIHLGYYQTALDAALARLSWEVQCPHWTCNHRGELVKAIKEAWPDFNERSL